MDDFRMRVGLGRSCARARLWDGGRSDASHGTGLAARRCENSRAGGTRYGRSRPVRLGVELHRRQTAGSAPLSVTKQVTFRKRLGLSESFALENLIFSLRINTLGLSGASPEK